MYVFSATQIQLFQYFYNNKVFIYLACVCMYIYALFFLVGAVFIVSFCRVSSYNNHNHSIPDIAKRTKIPSALQLHANITHGRKKIERKKRKKTKKKWFVFFFFFFSALALRRPSNQPDITGATRLLNYCIVRHDIILL